MVNNLSIKSVANAFLQRSFEEQNFVTPMKLQKLTFLACGYYLAATGHSLITLPNERFKAWSYGPVSPCLYNEFKEFGGEIITREATELIIHQDGEMYYIPVPPANNDPTLKRIIDYVWNTYKSWTAFQLSDLSHQSGWAWERVRLANPNCNNLDIPDDYILKDFKPFVIRKD